MGLFCVNLHLRTTDEGALSAALKRRRVSRSRIVPAKGGWISVYEARASEQDDGWIRELAGGLSKELDVAAIAFMVHDSDIACYWLFDKGELLDEYNSDPDYFDEDGDGPPSPAGGRADVMVRYCRKGVQQKELAAILAGDNLFAERVIEQLAYRLGIDRERALADYRNVADGEMPGGSDDDDDGDHDDGLDMSTLRAGLADRMAKMLGAVGSGAAADPQVAALVQAAASGNVDEIDRLLA